jgi:hypothetical protein
MFVLLRSYNDDCYDPIAIAVSTDPQKLRDHVPDERWIGSLRVETFVNEEGYYFTILQCDVCDPL